MVIFGKMNCYQAIRHEIRQDGGRVGITFCLALRCIIEKKNIRTIPTTLPLGVTSVALGHQQILKQKETCQQSILALSFLSICSFN